MTICATDTDAPPLTIERARALNNAMVELFFEAQDLRKCPWSQITLMREATLIELASAAAVLKQDEDNQVPDANGGRSYSFKCDDRLVAAIYAFLHFAVPPAHTQDDDDFLILKLSDGVLTSFLICGVREASEIETDQDEEDVA